MVNNNLLNRKFLYKTAGLLLVLNLYMGKVHGQNTGIGTNNPQQKLDVNGNLNISGNVLLNQTPGQAGQVLMTNGSGNSVWDFQGDFRNVVTYNTNNSFTVPNGVSRIMVECWGGGGGATPRKGGGSGGYIRGYFTVASLQLITLVVGNGGTGGANGGSSGSGGSTTATAGAITITASGGGGSSTSANGLIGNGGDGGGYGVTPSTFRTFIGVNGNPGTYTRIQYTSNLAGTIWKETYFGNGGNAPEWPSQNGGKGEYLVTGTGGYLEGGGGNIPTRPGGGGAGNSAFNNQPGAPGLIRIWY